MSRIGEGQGPGQAGMSGVSSPRSDSIRSAITANMNGQAVDTDMAPMMPDLLTRLDAVAGTQKPSDLGMPSPPNPVSPPNPSQNHAAMRSAGSKLRGAVSQATDGRSQQALQDCLEVVEHFNQMKEEVLHRSEFESGNNRRAQQHQQQQQYY